MGYITTQQVLDALDPRATADLDDGDLWDSIELWSQFVDRATRQWFEPRTKTLLVDGNGTDTLFLPVPIISVAALYVNGDFVNAVTSSEFTVYSGDEARKNPKLKLNGGSYGRDIFLPLQRRMGVGFARGNKNQRVVGTFGYIEADGSTPRLIQRAVLRLVANNVGRRAFAQSIAAGGGWVKSESTDGHSISYGFPETKVGTMGITRDAEVEAILQMYKGPILLAAPGGRGSWWSLG